MAYEPQIGHGAHARARDVQLVGEDELTTGNTLFHLCIGGRGMQRDARQHPFEAGGVEVVVADRAEIQEYRAHRTL